MERIVTEGPETSLLTIHINAGFTHSTVKEQSHFFVGGSIKTSTVPSGTYIRQSPCASCFQRRLFLKILCDGHILKIIVHIERTKDSPVMWKDD